MEIHEKHFKEWMGIKERLHNRARIPHVSVGDIWWCSIGENVGVEIDGKSSLYSRPVIVFAKFGRYGFWGIPTTTAEHSGSWYVRINFQGRFEYVALAQARFFSVSRLYRRMGTIDECDMQKLRDGFRSLLFE